MPQVLVGTQQRLPDDLDEVQQGVELGAPGALPVIEHAAFGGLIDQSTPLPPGNGSESVTPFALPAPVLFTVMVKPIGSPALTEPASAVFVMCSAGHCTVVEALACTLGLFVAWALAVLV